VDAGGVPRRGRGPDHRPASRAAAGGGGSRRRDGFGIQGYIQPGDPAGPKTIAGVARSLAPQMLAAGIATEDELGLDTLEQRIADELATAGATVVLPTVSGAFGRRAA
jgi:hypothetical protein